MLAARLLWLAAVASAQQIHGRSEPRYAVCSPETVTLLADANTIPWFKKEMFIPAEGQEAEKEEAAPRSITCSMHGRVDCCFSAHSILAILRARSSHFGRQPTSQRLCGLGRGR